MHVYMTKLTTFATGHGACRHGEERVIAQSGVGFTTHRVKVTTWCLGGGQTDFKQSIHMVIQGNFHVKHVYPGIFIDSVHKKNVGLYFNCSNNTFKLPSSIRLKVVNIYNFLKTEI